MNRFAIAYILIILATLLKPPHRQLKQQPTDEGSRHVPVIPIESAHCHARSSPPL